MSFSDNSLPNQKDRKSYATGPLSHHSYICLRDKDKKDKLGKERREESDEGKNPYNFF
jgi:hypothetical protein